MFQHYLHELLWKEIERHDQILKKSDSKSGISSGYKNLDTVLGGFIPGNIYLVASHQSVGKTTFLLNLLVNMNSRTEEMKHIILYTPGMSAHLVTQRMISCITGIYIDKIARGKLLHEEFHLFKALLMEHFSIGFPTCTINDNPILSVKEISDQLGNYLESERPEIVIIDDVLFMQTMNNGSRDTRISEIMTALKEIAEKFQLPVILSARIEKKGVEKNEMSFPLLSDLRLSGIIEQLADVILMINHPVVYEVIQNSHKIVKGEMHIRIEKNKGGRLSLLKFRVNHMAQRYYELEN